MSVVGRCCQEEGVGGPGVRGRGSGVRGSAERGVQRERGGSGEEGCVCGGGVGGDWAAGGREGGGEREVSTSFRQSTRENIYLKVDF